jgi:hypothetical protein
MANKLTMANSIIIVNAKPDRFEKTIIIADSSSASDSSNR